MSTQVPLQFALSRHVTEGWGGCSTRGGVWGGWAQGPLSPSLINRKGGCDGEPGFPTSTFCSIMEKAGCGSSFTDPQTIHSKAWPRAGVFFASDVARRGLGQSTCLQMLRTPRMPWSLAYAQRLPWPSLP